MKQKRTSSYLIGIIILSFLLRTTSNAQTNRHALLLGINYFQQQDKVSGLSGENDINLVEKSLLQQGFNPQNIVKLSGPQATYQAFVNRMEALIQRCLPGDVVLLHLSTHGFRVADTGVLDENDNFDEAIAFYDLRIEQQNFHSGFLLDDNFAQYLQRIRTNIGTKGQLICVLDACFSAGLNRGTETSGKQYERSSLLDVKPLSQGNTVLNLAPGLLISSSEGNQITKTLGSINYSLLSYAFSRQFAQLSKRMTFQAFFDEMKAHLTSIDINQRPQIAGDPNTVFLFGGRLESLHKHYSVEQIISPSLVQISGGEMAEHLVGEEVVFMPTDRSLADTNLIRPLARGRIKETRIWSSLVQITAASTSSYLNTWVFVSRVSLYREACSMKIMLNGVEKQRELAMAFGTSHLPSNDQNPSYLLQQNGNLIQLRDHTGFVLLTVQEREQDWALKVKNAIQIHRQCMLLRRTDWQDPNIVPVFNMQLTKYRVPKSSDAGLVPKQKYSVEQRRDSDGIHLFANRDTVTLTIENQGNADFYYTIIDVQPDHRLNFLAPLPQENDFTNYFLKSGQKKELSYPLAIAPPLGMEYFILLATSKPLVNLTQILTRGILTETVQVSNFESMINASVDPEIWAGGTSLQKLVQPNQTTVKKIIFTIE